MPAIVMFQRNQALKSARRRNYRSLEPLWSALHKLYPADHFRDDGRDLRTIHQRYYRRVIECRDGFVQLSPHLVGVDTTDDIADAIRTWSHQGIPDSGKRQAQSVAPALGDSASDDAQSLLAISRALRTREKTTV